MAARTQKSEETVRKFLYSLVEIIDEVDRGMYGQEHEWTVIRSEN